VFSLAKNLKLNITNSKLAEALKLKKVKLSTAGKKKEKKIEKAPSQGISEEPKAKARILPPIEKKPPEIKEEIKEAEKKTAKTKKTALHEVEEKPIAAEPAVEEKKIAEEIKFEKELPKKEEAKATEETPKSKEEKPEEKKVLETKKPVEEKPKIEIAEEPRKKEKPLIVEEKPAAPKDFKAKKFGGFKNFDTRDRLGLSSSDEERWRKKRPSKQFRVVEKIEIVRPKELSVKLPISLKDLATAMKLKATELIAKLFLQGIVITLNDYLDDELTIQLLGQEFGCDITIDRSEEQRLQITSKTIKKEIEGTSLENLQPRPPIITFMGHVDHGKTSIIDCIRKSNVAAGEAGAITQHIGAFTAKTPYGTITILDTPGHEAFSQMRTRGALVTDIVVLVIAGDEGIREQTIEAMNQAKEAKVPILVAINKSDKQGFDAEKVYRQLADHNLLPEAWGGTTITVNCSAAKNININSLLEMISLQAEILELKADPHARARGTILESQMHTGLGAVATVLIQNGTLKLNDAFVFGTNWGRIKAIHDQNGKTLSSAGPSTPVKISGLSTLADAGCEIIVVADEKEAKKIAHDRAEGIEREKLRKAKKGTLDLSQHQKERKELSVVLRADVQGSLEALVNALKKIQSKKIDLNVISAEVGEISESDINFAVASNAIILGFHTRIEAHAEPLIKELKVKVLLHDIIYHAIDDIKNLMVEKLDKIPEENDTGAAEVKAIFKSSHLGKIAGCIVTDGTIKRGQHARLVRNGEIIWKGKIASLKRVKEDVREVSKGVECGILLENFQDVLEKDFIQVYDVTYLTQEL